MNDRLPIIMQNKSTRKIIGIVLVIFLLASPFLFLYIKDTLTNNQLKNSFNSINIPKEFILVGHVCANEEFRPFCEYRYYSPNTVEQDISLLLPAFADASFEMQLKKGGLNGPNQTAYTGTNSSTKKYLTFIEIDRSAREDYQKNYGNVHFRMYPAQ